MRIPIATDARQRHGVEVVGPERFRRTVPAPSHPQIRLAVPLGLATRSGAS